MAKRRTALPELLSPAGTMECFYAAVEAGADAVYVGGELFSARAFAGNFSREELSRAVVYAHAYGVKLYVAVNTLLFDGELPEALDYVGYLDEIGVDAVIVADMGLAAAIALQYPRLPMHASTQASVHDSTAASAAAALGFSRVVPARELSRENIAALVEETPTEIEVFLHGALCVCHSGQCLFSSLVGGRSGNRGACAQPCRLPYREGYALSLKDLCLADYIPDLIELGVASLKIEGRMKSASYVYGVTRIYRRLLDERRAATAEEKATLARLFSRSGFTDGYFVSSLGKEMLGVRSQKDKDESRTIEERPFSPKPIQIEAEAVLEAGRPASLSLRYGAISVTATGEAPEAAKAAALTEEDVAARLMKLGATPFALEKENLKLTLEEGLFLPVSAQNALRRDAAALLCAALASQREKNGAARHRAFEGGEAHAISTGASEKEEAALSPALIFEKTPRLLASPSLDLPKGRALKTALLYNAALLDKVDFSDFDTVFLPLLRYFEAKTAPNGVALPPVLPDSERKEAKRLLIKAKEKGAKFALCGGLGTALLAAEVGLAVVGDFRLNVTNSYSAAAYKAMGFSAFLLSPELSAEKIRALGEGGAIVYGRIPLMITERCFTKDIASCSLCDRAALHDRMDVAFPLMREYGHRTLIFNSLPTYMGDKRALLSRLGLVLEHFIFSTETPKEARTVLEAYKTGASLPKARRFPKE